MKQKQKTQILTGITVALVLISFVILLYSGHFRENHAEADIPEFVTYSLWIMPWLGLVVLLYILRQKEHRGFVRRSIAVVIVYLLLLTSCTGLFLHNGVEEETDAQLFSAIGGTSEELEAAIETLDASVENDGLRIELRQAVCDEHQLYILFDVVSLTGRDLQFSDYFEGCWLEEEEGDFTSMVDVTGSISRNQKRMSFVASIESREKLTMGEKTVRLENFMSHKNTKTDEAERIEGDWILTFQLTKQIPSRTIYPDAPISQGNVDLRLQRVEVSTLSCYMIFDLEEGNTIPDEQWCLDDWNVMELLFSDDSSAVINLSGSTWSEDDESEFGILNGKIYDRFQVEDICGIAFDGTEILFE